jgi:precorrin-2 methylase
VLNKEVPHTSVAGLSSGVAVAEPVRLQLQCAQMKISVMPATGGLAVASMATKRRTIDLLVRFDPSLDAEARA